MLFSSIPFLYYFLPCVLIVYFAAPRRFKNTVLLLASLVFYGWGEPKYLLFMLLSIAQGYLFGRLIEAFRGRGRWPAVFMAASAAVSLGLLGVCKYADFFIRSFNAVTGLSLPLLNIALPIGISFYTFQILSYIIDVYRGSVRAQRSFIDLAAYISMFPQLIAGPIVRYADVEGQLRSRTHTLAGAAAGARRFLIGLAKKVLLANQLFALVSAFKASADRSVLFCWLYAVAYTLHIYFDFSGYSDMAIGLGRIFGFQFMENFNYPYIAGSITDFWRRWHISLSTWFRDYVYIPLGGNRHGLAKQLRNIAIVWLLTGLWHGADWNFVLWGLLYALLLTAEKLFLLRFWQRHRAAGHLFTLLFVLLGFVLFDADSLSGAFGSIGALFGAGGLPAVSAEAVYYLKSYAVVLAVAIVGCTPLPAAAVRRLSAGKTGQRLLNLAEPAALSALLLMVTAFLVDGSFNPFLYFRF